VSENIISPFGTPIDYYSAVDSGFIVHPSSKEVPDGWGSPLYGTDGNKLWPGTPGGKQSNTLLTTKKGKWIEKKNIYVQSVGNIDWWGTPFKIANPNDRRILSFWGPITRYFPDGFVYGSEAKHSEVYYRGKIAGIAPGPVLGAAMQLIANTNLYNLVVICWVNYKEVVYRRKFGTLAADYALTPENRAAMAKLYHADHNPTGWVTLGEINTGEVSSYAPDSPWFFNKSGTEAQAIRRKELNFDPGTGTPVTEIVGDRYKATVTIGGSVSTTKMTAEPPFVYKEKCEKDANAWVSPNDTYGDPHYWDEDHIKFTIEHTGTQCVAVDYIDDTEVVCTFNHDINITLYQDWMIGTDPGGWPHPNTGQLDNVQPNSWENVPRGHRTQTWTSMNMSSYLEWTTPTEINQMLIEGMIDLTRLEYDVGVYDPEDKYRYYTEHYQLFPRHLDLRKFYVFGKAKRYTEFLTVGGLTYKNPEYEMYDQDAADQQFYAFMESAPADSVGSSGQGYSRATMLTWQANFNWNWQKTSYVGPRPEDNDDGSKGMPKPKDFYAAPWVSIKAGWKGLNLIRHSYFSLTTGFAQRPSGQIIGSLLVPYPGGETLMEANIVLGAADLVPETLTGGTRLYPLGVA